jgi:1,4-alpha-glucan branching enzyme
MSEVGSFALVLHTHLPWVAHHGTWPVGEEWLHQAFTGSWRRVIGVLDSLAEQGVREVATLGVTPVTAAMLDDPYCLAELHSWAGRWQLRAEGLGTGSDWQEFARWERAEATACLADLEARWLRGGLSSVLRPLLDSRVIELLSGPATHPFQPLLTDRFAAAQLRTGLDDAQLRFGRRPAGIWAPECGYAPGMAEFYAGAGVARFVVDGPAVGGRTGAGFRLGSSGVACFARDLAVSERVWASGRGYPAGPDYRDFHTFDHASGFRASRVTALDVPAADKARWRPGPAMAAARRDAADFVAVIVARLRQLHAEQGRPGLVVTAFDTELFGHWWYEGPQFLASLLRLLPEAGVTLTTLAGAERDGLVTGRIELGPSSWGAGKDWRVWDNERVAGLATDSAHVQKRLTELVDAANGAALRSGYAPVRNPALDQLAREAMLLTSSDWAFMVTRDSAAGYARDRAAGHAKAFADLAATVEHGDVRAATAEAARLRRLDGPFGHVDGRLF